MGLLDGLFDRILSIIEVFLNPIDTAPVAVDPTSQEDIIQPIVVQPTPSQKLHLPNPSQFRFCQTHPATLVLCSLTRPADPKLQRKTPLTPTTTSLTIQKVLV
jgi:hypothetical protein